MNETPPTPDPILTMVKDAQEAARAWERTELRLKADNDQLERLADKMANLRTEIDTKQGQLTLACAEHAHLSEVVVKRDQWLYDHHEEYRKNKEIGSDELVKHLQDKIVRLEKKQAKEMADAQAELDAAKG